MTGPPPSGDRGKSSEQLLAEALRARAGGAPAIVTRPPPSSRPVATRPLLTLVQLVLTAAVGGLVVGILIAVLTLI
ncbi:MAG: hypothetical protein ABJA16_01445 [Nakamurella sp.]